MTGSLVALAALVAALIGAPSAGPSGAEILGDPRYGFCHDDDYLLDRWEHRWCPLVGEHNEACPGLPGDCKRKARRTDRSSPPPGCSAGGSGEPDGAGRRSGGSSDGAGDAAGTGPPSGGSPGDSAGRDGSSRSGSSGDTDGRPRPQPGDGDGQRASPPPRDPPAPRTITLPSGVSGFAQLTFFLLLAVGLGLLVWVIVRARLAGRDEDDLEAPPGDEASAEPAPGALRIVETDVERLLSKARQAAGRGDYEQAIADAYAAMLRRLEGDGLIDVHASRTNADYLRALRKRPELAAPVRAIVQDVERVQFGATAASPSLFESLLARVLPLTARSVLLLVFALAATLVCPAAAWAGDLGGSSTAPSGSRGVVELLRQRDIEVSYRIEELSNFAEDLGVLVILPGGGPKDGNWDSVLQWVKKGGTLVLAGELPSDERVGIRYRSDPSGSRRLTGAWRFENALEQLDLQVPPGGAIVVDPEGLEALPMLVRVGGSESLYGVHGRLGRGQIMALADEHLFTNIALALGDNGEAVVRILTGHGPVQICTSWTGAAASSPFESVHRAKLTPLIAQLLLLLALFFLWKGIAFGQLRDPAEKTRRRFADHVRAVGLQYARARASAHALGAYARWALERLRERVPRGRQSDLDELADKLSVRSGWRAEEIAALLRHAQAASDAGSGASLRPSSLRAGLEPSAQALRLMEPKQQHSQQHVELMQRLAELVAALGRRGESS